MYRMYGIRAMQRDAAFRSDASGTPRASNAVDSTEDFRFTLEWLFEPVE